MMRNPLTVVRTLRERAVDQLRRDLAACLGTEAAVAARIAELGDAGRRDRGAHDAVDEPHRFQDMFTARRSAVEAATLAALGELSDAEARSAEIRAALVAARVAAEAVEGVIAERATLMAAALERRQQLDLEEVARFGKRFSASGE